MAHILVVDDILDNSYLLSALLRSNDYSVDVAANGREALEIARMRLPDLVISDILMPVMDGFTFCRQWMQDPQLRVVPFIFYSATYTDPQDISFGLSLGACRYITKPADPEEFLAIVLAVLDEYEAEGLPPVSSELAEEPVYLKVYNERLVNRLEHQMLQADAANRRLAALLQVSAELALLQPERDLIEHALTTITRVMGYTRSHYFAFDPTEQALRYQLAVGEQNETSVDIRSAMVIPLGEEQGLVGLVAQQGEPLIIDDTAQEPRWVQADPSIRSALLVPVTHDDNLYGVCTFVSTELSAFSVEDLQNATILANTLAIAIENTRLYRKQVEMTHHLEELVEERTADLSIALEKAEAAERLKTQFIADINHELRTPLTSIGLYLDLLPRVKEERRDEIIQVMKRETTVLSDMIEDLLDLSRLDLGHVEMQLGNVQVEQFVEMLMTDRKHLAEAKGLSLTTNPLAAVSPVRGDQTLIYQVLTNLVVNAINYTRSGTIAIDCKEVIEDGVVWSTVSVADTGPGIAPDEMEHLFERFFRGAAAHARGTPGTGLGLAICQEIVQRHGGRLTVQSELGQGSTFVVWLPAAPIPS